jgi:intracellular septation protein A
LGGAFLYCLVPLMIFVVIDSLAGLRLALVFAFAASLAEIAVIYQQSGHWDPLAISAAGLILLLGGVTFFTSDRRYVKFQPVILSLLMAIFLGYLQLSSEPLVFRYRSLILASTPPFLEEYVHYGGFFETINFFVNWAVGLFVVNAMVIAYAALYCSALTWLITRALSLWVLMLLMLCAQFAYLYFWVAPLIN